ncbi:Terminase small subunit [Gemmata obscuriglobus]|uniref:Terminase small subunit n=1 Tax=Gemmata obscuriglobus TaxID=114 RepID=A0A2Z3HIU4_9BACT|nr:terminase small subunit [Gemmata obscuriglobus]AWM41754.1 terminase small subunit [Gemmata obscuriglobus]QEG32294.1 Terminase small subunit [Gemmata obscuriglobus]VTS11650.1 hypothetical protein : Uncharacterized protein OS=Comamonas testosteroni GN=P353_19750 PE=4 SV=1: Terminase_2 [Gemmata obscuriglobus UQM 2246]
MALTAQQELFCVRYIARKFNATDAYQDAYPKASRAAARANAPRLLANDDISKRVAELFDAAAAADGITPQRVIRELGLIAFQRNKSLYRDDGTFKPPTEWDEATDATVAAVETEEEFAADDSEPEESREPQAHGGELKRARLKVNIVRTVKVKRWDKLRALEILSKHFGLLKEDGPHQDRPKIDTSKLTDADKRAVLAAARRAIVGPST